jgi:hypothetical protein
MNQQFADHNDSWRYVKYQSGDVGTFKAHGRYDIYVDHLPMYVRVDLHSNYYPWYDSDVVNDMLGDFSLDRLSTWGPRVVFDSRTAGTMDQIQLVDLGANGLAVIGTAEPGDWAVDPDISGPRVVWTEFHYEASRTRAVWRVRARNLDSGEIRTIASGTDSSSAGSAWPALTRIDGDLVAYGAPARRAGHPNAWSILVRSLTSGQVVRTIEIDRKLVGFDLADGNVAYIEGTRDEAGNFTYDTRLMISTVSHPEPVQVDRDVYAVAAGGNRFAWEQDRVAGQDQSPMPETPVILTATVSQPTPVQVSVMTQGPPPPEGFGRPRLGGLYPSVANDLVAWQDAQTDGTWAGQLYRVVVWDASSGQAHQIDPRRTRGLSGSRAAG